MLYEQLNEITPYLDGGLVYGTAKGWADVLRTFTNGTLARHGLLAWHDQVTEHETYFLIIGFKLFKY